MAELSYSILFLKSKTGATVKDLLSDFSMVCTEFAFPFALETKDMAIDDWADEDGEDTYIPDVLPVKAYDLEVKIAYSGNKGTANTAMITFRNYLTGYDGSGVELSIYNPHILAGRQKAYLKSISDPVFNSDNIEDNVTFTVTFRVTDPITNITLTY